MAGMELLVRLEEAVRLPPGETARLTNAVARLFEVYQSGRLVLHKLKTGGTQRVVVQYQQRAPDPLAVFQKPVVWEKSDWKPTAMLAQGTLP